MRMSQSVRSQLTTQIAVSLTKTLTSVRLSLFEFLMRSDFRCASSLTAYRTGSS
jgi:hypothetical protein